MDLGFPIRSHVEFITLKQVINEVDPGSKVNVKGHLQLDKITTRKVNGDDVPFQRGYISDNTGSINLALWREYTGLEDKSYAFTSLTKSMYNNEVQLQSISSTALASIPEVDHVSPSAVEDEILKEKRVICANFITKSKCIACNENLGSSDESGREMVTCTKCEASFLRGFLTTVKLWKLFVQVDSTRLTLTCDNDMLTNCFKKDFNNLDIEQGKLLILASILTISYKVSNNEIIDMQCVEPLS